ncbi:MAG: ABC transporter ATP-binding protein [Leptolyngbyaceae cyanobacterium CSU_1_3]|nr:ABC transporter ATP-binding protein [Leptolyngbyaceae cyanobacterium CSU_1_3]
MINVAIQEVLIEPPPSQGEVVLSVNQVSKRFCRDLKRSLIYGVQDIASELTGLRQEGDFLRPKEFWALDLVSFQLRRGEAVGLIGKNGSGKSTLLRIIAGLIKPDMGTVEVRGQVAPLIALGAGFNPILTGRENVFANMSILGLTRQEIVDRLDEVIDFAEIGDALDSPVQTYSSGMAARLGFACAIHTKPDILLIDEVLAVGDVKFRCKCYRKLNELQKNGTAFVLVSHSANSILAVCDSGVYINQGKVICTGAVSEVVTRYETDLFQTEAVEAPGKVVLPEKLPHESFGLDIRALSFKDTQGEFLPTLISGEPASLSIECDVHEAIDDLCVEVLIRDQFGEGEWMLRFTNVGDQQPIKIASGRREVRVNLPYCGMKPGLYVMKLSIRRDRMHYLDAIESFKFSVTTQANMSSCAFYQPRQWQLANS